MKDFNLVRAQHLLKRIEYPIDLIKIWKSFDGYSFNQIEKTEKSWWQL